MNPNDRKYSREHEWVKLEGDNRALVGITEYAQEQLGDIVYFDLPQVGTRVTQMGKIAEVESVKAVSDVYSPVSGEITEVNSSLINRPELVNEDPFAEGWLVRVALSDPSELNNLMTAEEYDAYLSGL